MRRRQESNERIATDPAVLSGKPIVGGTRIPVYLIVGLVEAVQTLEQIVDDYPDLTVEDVVAALAYDAKEQVRTAGWVL